MKKSIKKHTQNILMSVATVAVLAGCSGTEAATSPKVAPLTDANIAAIVVGANNIDISAADIALQRSKNVAVRKFAIRMKTDHKAVLDSAVKLVTRLGVTPVNNDLVATLTKQSQDHEAKLRTLSGKAFDQTYIDHEVAYHKAVISVIEDQLIPGATNKELKDTLISVVPAFKAHLKHSEMVQSEI